jgi:carboxymethylenebutenolidase
MAVEPAVQSPARRRSWLKRISIAVVIVLALAILVPLAWALGDALLGSSARDVANVAYKDDDGNELAGYLARPEGAGPHPAILLLHEWWGLNHEITALADALAREGYVVFAPDAYRGRVGDSVPGALWLRLTTPDTQIHADLDSALAYLRALPEVAPARVASMGFCFGGQQSLQLSLRQPENLAATVMYYGAVVTAPELLRPLADDDQPVLGIFGETDNSIPVAEVEQFAAALDGLGIANEVTIYPGVGHAFVNDENYDQPGPAGAAWRQAVEFLGRQLQHDAGE